MKAFRGTNGEYVASIAVEASTIGDVTVAVAVYATRYDEIAILDSVRERANAMQVTFVPFKSKSRHFDKRENSAFFECVIKKNKPRLRALHFRHHSASRNQHYVEAVLTALLVSDFRQAVEGSAFVLVDGDEQKVVDFARAFTGFDGAAPTVSNCYRAELYYPHALLADLSAGYLANQIDRGEYDYTNPILRTPPADRTRTDEWGQAFDHLQTKARGEYQVLGANTAYGETERERAKTWFEGSMGRTPADGSPAISIRTVASNLRSRGYEAVAERLREL